LTYIRRGGSSSYNTSPTGASIYLVVVICGIKNTTLHFPFPLAFKLPSYNWEMT